MKSYMFVRFLWSFVYIVLFFSYIQIGAELNQRIKTHEQTIEQLRNELDQHINVTIERYKKINEIVSKFCCQSNDQDTDEG